MISKYLNTGGFAIVLLCFLMPFVSIKCNDMELVKLNGYDLIIGKDIKPPKNPMLNGLDGNTGGDNESAAEEQSDSETDADENSTVEKPKKSKDAITTNWFMVVILLAGLTGLVTSLMAKGTRGISQIGIAGVALLSQILFVVILNAQLNSKSGGGTESFGIKLSLGYNFGFWLMLLSLLFIIGYNIYNNVKAKPAPIEPMPPTPPASTEPEPPANSQPIE